MPPVDEQDVDAAAELGDATANDVLGGRVRSQGMNVGRYVVQERLVLAIDA